MDESGFRAAFRAPDMGTAWKDAGLREAFSWKRLAAIGTLVTTVTGCRVRLFGHKERCREKSGRHQIFERSEAIHARAKIALIWDSLLRTKVKSRAITFVRKKNGSRWNFAAIRAGLEPGGISLANISRMEMANFCAANLGQVTSGWARPSGALGIIRISGVRLKHSGLFLIWICHSIKRNSIVEFRLSESQKYWD